jgi:hypothetical protein
MSSIDATFIEFCAKVRSNDPTIMPELGRPFKIRHLSDEEDTELADALLENKRVTYLELETQRYSKSSTEAIAKYVRTSKRLKHIHWPRNFRVSAAMQEEMFCCFLPAIQESTSLRELHM